MFYLQGLKKPPILDGPIFFGLLLLIVCFRHLLLLVVYFCYVYCLSFAFATLVIHYLFFLLLLTIHHLLLSLFSPCLLFIDYCSLSFTIVIFYCLPLFLLVTCCSSLPIVICCMLLLIVCCYSLPIVVHCLLLLLHGVIHCLLLLVVHYCCLFTPFVASLLFYN